MPTWLKVILILFTIAVLFFIGVGIVGYYWVSKNKDRLVNGGKSVHSEGQTFGKGKDAQACVDEALARLRRSKGFMEQVSTRIFVKGCLGVADPSPTLCADAPRRDEIIATAKWSVQQCSKRGMSDDQGCAGVMQDVALQCHK